MIRWRVYSFPFTSFERTDSMISCLFTEKKKDLHITVGTTSSVFINHVFCNLIVTQ